jgi:aryl-alcohol dehydrogenase-like predicted oxidoreductase
MKENLRIGQNWSRIGLGCWQLGDDCWGDVTEDAAQMILREAYEAGVTFFDTADVYGSGLSEQRISRFLKSTGAQVEVATKIGRFSDPGWPANFNKPAMRQHIEACISRLGVQSLDLVQLHCLPTEVLAQGRVFDHLRDFQAEGLIKAWGVSVESVEEGLLCLTQPGLASLQVILNVLRQHPLQALLPRAEQMGVAIIVRLPLASGVLAGKYTKETTFSDKDHRKFNADGQAFHVGETFNGLPFHQAVEFAETLKQDLPEGRNLAEASLRWLLDQPAVTTIIPGASKVGQVTRNMKALELPSLPASTHERWSEFYKGTVAPHLRGMV